MKTSKIKEIFAMLSVVFAMFFAVNSLMAIPIQVDMTDIPDPCSNQVGCSGGSYNEWQGPNVAIIKPDECQGIPDGTAYGSVNCEMTIVYYYRDCPGLLHIRDYQIVLVGGVKTSNNNHNIICHNCFNQHDNFNIALVNLIRWHSPSQPSWYYNYEKHSCYKTFGGTSPENVGDYLGTIETNYPSQFEDLTGYINTNDNQIHIPLYGYSVACNTPCCTYKVDLTRNNDNEIIDMETNPEYVHNEPCEEDCQGGCEDMEFKWSIDDGIYAKQSINNYIDNTYITVKPNPASDNITLEVLSEYLGECKLIITSVDGTIVENISFNKKVLDKEIGINTQNFSSGVYYYKLIARDFEISNGSFIIKK